MSTDGLLHPQIQTVQARTLRMSITKPAMQTLPRPDEDDPDARYVRQAIIPREENHRLVSSDFSQIELRTIAALSEDPGLIEVFQDSDATGGDIFVSTMKMVYGDPTLTKSDPRRTPIKSVMYAASYGAGVAKMAQTARVSVEEMRSVYDAVFGRFSGVKKYMKVCEREAQNNDNWVTTPFGRRVWVDPEVSYKALNAKVQAFAGDMFKQTIVNLAQAGLEEFMVCPVHDEVVFSIPEAELEDVRHTIAEVMPYNDLKVPVPADPSPGVKTWAECK
jgi:DNA polymerase-1